MPARDVQVQRHSDVIWLNKKEKNTNRYFETFLALHKIETAIWRHDDSEKKRDYETRKIRRKLYEIHDASGIQIISYSVYAISFIT